MAGVLLYFMQLSKQFPTLGWPGVKQKAPNNSKIPLKLRRFLPEVSLARNSHLGSFSGLAPGTNNARSSNGNYLISSKSSSRESRADALTVNITTFFLKCWTMGLWRDCDKPRQTPDKHECKNRHQRHWYSHLTSQEGAPQRRVCAESLLGRILQTWREKRKRQNKIKKGQGQGGGGIKSAKWKGEALILHLWHKIFSNCTWSVNINRALGVSPITIRGLFFKHYV